MWIFVIIFLSPVVLALITAHSAQKNWSARFLRRLGFRTIHHIPTAWDYQFSREKPAWVLVTLKNGSTVAGLFGERSFAGDDPQNRDLYLEAVYRQTDAGWEENEQTFGILINATEIATIEFYEIEGETYEE